MSNLTINNGGIITNSRDLPNLDLRYGPYDSIESATEALGDLVTPGLTIGIQNNERIIEYQVNNDYEFIPKTTSTQSNYDSLENLPKINNIELKGNKTNEQLGIPTKTSDLVNDSGFISEETEPSFNSSPAKDITENDIEYWNNKSDFSGSYDDLTNKPTIPSKTSDLVNDSGFLTSESEPAFNSSVAKNITENNVENWNSKQEELESGVNIKTINNESILGNGNIIIPKGDDGAPGNNGHNPCLGRFSAVQSTFAETLRAGDYYYVDTVDNTTTPPTVTETKIYKYDGTQWDSGTVVDVSNLTFNSGETVIGTSIDGTGLKNPLPNSLAKAEDVKNRVVPLEEKFDHTGYSFDVVTDFEVKNLYINSSNKWASGWSMDFLEVTPGDKIKLTRQTTGGFVALLKSTETFVTGNTPAFSDAEGWSNGRRNTNEITGAESGGSGVFTVPNDAGWLYVSRQSSTGSTGQDVIVSIGREVTIPGIDTVVVQLATQIAELPDKIVAESRDVPYTLESSTGSVNGENGADLTASLWTRTAFIDVSELKGKKISFLGRKVAASTNKVGYAFYSENAASTVVSHQSYENDGTLESGEDKWYEVVVPQDANYFRASVWNNSKDEFRITVKSALVELIEDVAATGDTDTISGITHLKPDNQGQLNTVKRMRKLTDVKYTPAFEFSRLSTGGGASSYLDVFLEGVTYKGIPYSRSYRKMTEYGYKASSSDYTGFKIGFYISLDTFITALSNHGTVMELESIFDHSTSGHNSSFYSNICAGCASAALGVGYISTESFWNIPNGFTSIGLISDVFDLTSLKLGDVLAKTGVHTVMVTDVIKNSNGDITHVEVSEGTTAGNDNYHKIGGKLGGVARRLWWTTNGFKKKWDGYKVIRYNNIANVPYIPNPYVPMSDEQYGGDAEYGSTPYYMAVLPYMGNKFRYVVSAAQLNNILKLVITVKERTYQSGSSTVTIDAKTNVVIERYNEDNDTWVELGVESIDYTEWDDITHPYVYVELSDEKYKVAGQYRAFAYVTRTYENGEYVYTSSDAQSSGKTRVCEWSVVENISLLTDF